MQNPFKRSTEKSELESARTSALAALSMQVPGSDDYRKIANEIERLSAQIQAERPKPERLSPNTLAIVLGNAGIAAAVLWFEQDNVVKTKLQTFITKSPK